MTLEELFGKTQDSQVPRHVFRMGDEFVGETFDAPVEDIYQLFKERLVKEVFAVVGTANWANPTLAPLVDQGSVPGVQQQADIAKLVNAANALLKAVELSDARLYIDDFQGAMKCMYALRDALKDF